MAYFDPVFYQLRIYTFSSNNQPYMLIPIMKEIINDLFPLFEQWIKIEDRKSFSVSTNQHDWLYWFHRD